MALTAQDVPDIAPRRLRQELGLSRERMARLLDVSAKTIERWEARPEPPANRTARKRLAQLREIVFLGLIVYTPEGFRRFLTTPMPVFDGRTALQIIENDEGEEVVGALAADYEGLGY